MVIYLGPGWDSISPSAHRSRSHSLTLTHCSRARAIGASSGLSLLSLPFVDRVLWWYISVACVMLVMVVVWLHPWRVRDVRGVLVTGVVVCVCRDPLATQKPGGGPALALRFAFASSSRRRFFSFSISISFCSLEEVRRPFIFFCSQLP